MPYRGGSLVDMFSVKRTTGPPTSRAVRGIVSAGGRALTDRAADNTPVGKTGRLKGAWRELPLYANEEGHLTSGTENRSPLAHLIELGVQAHEIEPKGGEALDVPGVDHPTGRVQHPGHRGSHMLARAVAEVEGEVQALAQPHLERWAEEIEARAKRHKGIR